MKKLIPVISIFISALAWSTETDDEIVQYLDFYQSLEILTDTDSPSLKELESIESAPSTDSKGST